MAEMYLPFHSQERSIRIARQTLKDSCVATIASPAKSDDARPITSIYRSLETFFKDNVARGWTRRYVLLIVAEEK